MNRRVELLISLLVVATGVVWLYLATFIHQTIKDDPIGERGLPNIMGWVFVVGGTALVVRTWRRMRAEGPQPWFPKRFNEPGDEEAYPASNSRPIIAWGLCMAWILSVETVGFLIVTPILIGAELWLLRFRRPVPLVLVGVVAAGFLWLLFDFALKINLPGGVLAPVTDSLHL